jgi:hypothetical protein
MMEPLLQARGYHMGDANITPRPQHVPAVYQGILSCLAIALVTRPVQGTTSRKRQFAICGQAMARL